MSEAKPLEAAHPAGEALGAGSALEDVDLLLAAHEPVMALTRSARAEIAAAVELLATCLSAGGRLLYVGAGTSGWLAALDGAEAIATFGVGERVQSLVAGGATLDGLAMTVAEDDTDAGRVGVADWAGGPRDVVIAVSASGRTPFTSAAMSAARDRGCHVVAIVSDPTSPMAQCADVSIAVSTAAELLAGSTRLRAGLAQKLVLNIVSTAAFVRVGRAFNGQMVCVVPGNSKLRERLISAVCAATGADQEVVRSAIAESGRGDVAVVTLVAGISPAEAAARLDRHRGNIALALQEGA